MADEEITTKRVKVVVQEQYSGGPFDFGDDQDGSLNDVIESLIEIRDSIPEEYREIARCEVSSTSGYEDSHYAMIEISYERPETSTETAERERLIRQQNAERLARAQAQYLHLKAQFEKV